MDVSKLKFKEVEKLPEYCSRNGSHTKRSELAKLVIDAPMNKWMRVTGFENHAAIRKAQAGIRAVSQIRELVGIRIKTATSMEHKELFFLKTKEFEPPAKKAEMKWTDGKLRLLPAGVYLEGTEDEGVGVRGARVA